MMIISINTFLSFVHKFTDFSQYLLESFLAKDLLVLRLHHILLVFNYDDILLLLIYTSL